MIAHFIVAVALGSYIATSLWWAKDQKWFRPLGIGQAILGGVAVVAHIWGGI